MALFAFAAAGRSALKYVWGTWFLRCPALFAFGIYRPVHMEERFIGAFMVLFWMGLIAGAHLPDTKDVQRLAVLVTTTVVILTTVGLLPGAFLRARTPEPHGWRNCQVAVGLRDLGVTAGANVAVAGDVLNHGWARLAGMHIVAEVARSTNATEIQETFAFPAAADYRFWLADKAVQSKVLDTFSSTGAAAVVARVPPYVSPPEGWTQLGGTDSYAHLLPVSISPQRKRFVLAGHPKTQRPAQAGELRNTEPWDWEIPLRRPTQTNFAG